MKIKGITTTPVKNSHAMKSLTSSMLILTLSRLLHTIQIALCSYKVKNIVGEKISVFRNWNTFVLCNCNHFSIAI